MRDNGRKPEGIKNIDNIEIQEEILSSPYSRDIRLKTVILKYILRINIYEGKSPLKNVSTLRLQILR